MTTIIFSGLGHISASRYVAGFPPIVFCEKYVSRAARKQDMNTHVDRKPPLVLIHDEQVTIILETIITVVNFCCCSIGQGHCGVLIPCPANCQRLRVKTGKVNPNGVPSRHIRYKRPLKPRILISTTLTCVVVIPVIIRRILINPIAPKSVVRRAAGNVPPPLDSRSPTISMGNCKPHQHLEEHRTQPESRGRHRKSQPMLSMIQNFLGGDTTFSYKHKK
jgi:hypothetical protein